VTHLGFIFYPPSPRSVTPQQAGHAAILSPNRIKRVGVFVDPNDELITEVIENLSPHILQLHGTETPSRISKIREKFNLPIMKAIKVDSEKDMESIRQYNDCSDIFLFDAKPPLAAQNSLPGGNGVSFDWSLLKSFKSEKPWFLSGGINLSNIKDALKVTGSNAVDVSSGVEDKPGIKNIKKIEQFMQKVKELTSK
ncbi:phosphoribosylanthranilate isomerase, partial [Rhodospirillaceae bacterium]|nr:phosphoribosylanthranilate isomerase [Rhodospirillaceae bacterium]